MIRLPANPVKKKTRKTTTTKASAYVRRKTDMTPTAGKSTPGKKAVA